MLQTFIRFFFSRSSQTMRTLLRLISLAWRNINDVHINMSKIWYVRNMACYQISMGIRLFCWRMLWKYEKNTKKNRIFLEIFAIMRNKYSGITKSLNGGAALCIQEHIARIYLTRWLHPFYSIKDILKIHLSKSTVETVGSEIQHFIVFNGILQGVY